MRYKKLKENAAVFNAITMTGVVGVLAKVFFNTYERHLLSSAHVITRFEIQMCIYGPYVIALIATFFFVAIFKPRNN